MLIDSSQLTKGLQLIKDFCKQNGIDDVLYNQKYLELLAAERHGMVYNPDPQGADATNPSTGGDVEIKCCKEGYSWQFHWLSNNKMQKLRNTESFILAVHDGYAITRSYLVDRAQLLGMIESKATGTANIGGHKSFTEKQLAKLGIIDPIEVNTPNYL